jgi:hypothetical protein
MFVRAYSEHNGQLDVEKMKLKKIMRHFCGEKWGYGIPDIHASTLSMTHIKVVYSPRRHINGSSCGQKCQEYPPNSKSPQI